MIQMEKEIIVFKDNDFSLEVNLDMKEKTVWLLQRQMAKLFNVTFSNINLHINNIFKEEELNKKTVFKESLSTASDGKNYMTFFYNLDVIISVGYRVKSKRGIDFRKWATKIIQEHLLKGYTVNQEKLSESKEHYNDFTKSVKFISELYKRKDLNKLESNSLFSVINKYSLALDTLDKYDHRLLTINNTTEYLGVNKLLYNQIISEIRNLSEYKEGTLFGREKDKSFESSISAIYQTAFDVELYPLVEEKAANLLYFIVKNHSFYDGNKRIAASVFIYFLDMNDILYL